MCKILNCTDPAAVRMTQRIIGKHDAQWIITLLELWSEWCPFLNVKVVQECKETQFAYIFLIGGGGGGGSSIIATGTCQKYVKVLNAFNFAVRAPKPRNTNQLARKQFNPLFGGVFPPLP